MFDIKSAMLYLLTEMNFEEVLYLFKKKTNEKKNHINESEKKFMFSLIYFCLPSHLHWIITLLFQDTNWEAKLQCWVQQMIWVYKWLQVISVHIGMTLSLCEHLKFRNLVILNLTCLFTSFSNVKYCCKN